MARLLTFPWLSPAPAGGLSRRNSALIIGLFLAAALAWPSPARADNDWLGIEVPQPINDGKFAVNVRVEQTENKWWQDGSYFATNDTDDLTDANDNQDIQDVSTIDTRLDWRVEPRLVLELDVPTVFSEFSPVAEPPGTVEYYSVNTPGVEESQGVGDMRLGLRGALRNTVEGFNAGWNLSCVAPTGLSPWSAPESMAATGAGRWQVLPGFVLGGQSENFEAWFQALGRIQLGQQAESSSADYISYGPQGGISLPQGGIWLGPRYGGDLVAGLAWIWYRDTDTRIALAVEAQGHWLSPWNVGGQDLSLPAESSFDLMPELQAHYGRFGATAGWQSTYFWAMEMPNSEYGEFIFDVAFTF
jgi:hypothetical protein